MTNPTPHGQVPEALIDLIDAYAETRHRCGGIYNAKTEAARKTVIEALSGVQALSAAPAGWKLVPVEPTVDQEWAGKNAALRCSTMGEACKIYKAMLSASPTPPAEQQAPNTGHAEADRLIGLLMSSDPDFEDCRQAAELIQREIKGPDGFGTWREAAIAERLARVNQQAAPKAAPAVDIATVGEAQAFEAWYKQDCVIEGDAAKTAAKAAWKARAMLAAEQQATTTEAALGGVYAELPAPLLIQYDEIDCEEFGCFAEGQMRDFADRTHALRMEQAAPKAAPALSSTEQAWVLRSPAAIAELLTFIDLDHSQGVSMLGPEGCPPWPPKRYTELKEIGRKIIEQDPDCFDAELLSTFGVASPTPPAEQPDLSKLTERGAKAWAGVDAQALRDGTYQAATTTGAALGVEQAAPKAAPESFLDGADVQDESGVLAYYSREAVLACINAALESVAAPKAAPVELHDHQILAITTAYEQGVGKGRQAHESGKEIANPYDTGYRCDLAWQYGYEEGKEQAERIAKAAPQQEAQEPCGWTTGITWRPDTRLQSEQVIKITRDAQPNYGYTTPIYTAPQQGAQEPDHSLRTDALCQLAYCNGMKAGWNYCVDGNEVDFARAMEGVSEAMKVLRELRENAPQPAPLSEREAFERDWEKRHAPVPINGRTHDDGRYGDLSIQDAWESWQARAALAAQGNK